MRTKDEIITAIKQTIKDCGDSTIGMRRFLKETGITSYECEQYWQNWGDALQEAGFQRNVLNAAYPGDFLIQTLITMMRRSGKFPTFRAITVARASDPQIPNKKVFQRFGTKEVLARKVLDFCSGKSEFQDVIDICKPVLEKRTVEAQVSSASSTAGEVYLFKSGRHYKIGKSNDTVRRGKELRVQLPHVPNLIHLIKTDDPSGVEAYWHRRFDNKRMNGEWFDLTHADIAAFKRWKRI